MKHLLLIAVLTPVSLPVLAADPAVINHAETFVALSCPSENHPRVVQARLTESRNDPDVYTYELSLADGRGNLVTLQAEKNAVDLVTLSKVYLPQECSLENLPPKSLSCGDHWFNVQYELNWKQNRAQLTLDGDSLVTAETYEASVKFHPLGENGFKLSLQTLEQGESVTYTLESQDKAAKLWTAERNGVYLGSFCQ